MQTRTVYSLCFMFGMIPTLASFAIFNITKQFVMMCSLSTMYVSLFSLIFVIKKYDKKSYSLYAKILSEYIFISVLIIILSREYAELSVVLAIALLFHSCSIVNKYFELKMMCDN